MKKITLVSIFLFAFNFGYSQCLTATNGQWPTTTFVPNGVNCNGTTIQEIVPCGFTREYSLVTVVSGQTYTFLSSIATDIVTISIDNGVTAITFGTGSVTWVATISGNIRFYTHVVGCGVDDTCRTRSLICGIPSSEVPDNANLQSPATTTTTAGTNVTIYGRVNKAGLTDVVPNIIGQAPGISAWVGYSTTNSNPNTWTNWIPATWNSAHVSDYDEYEAGLGSTLALGTYYYATRFRLNSGLFVYGGLGNFWNATTNQSGVITVLSAVPNDLFANAIAVSCGNIYTGDTTLADLDQSNAPSGFGCDMDSRNVWYKFTGTGTAQTVTLDLCGSSYDTSVLVYTGAAGNLSIIAANDDDTSCASSGVNSKVVFTSNGTTTYYIAIEGYNDDNFGPFTMNVTCAASNPPAVANQTCALSLPVLVDGIDVSSDNSFGNVTSQQPSCDAFGTIQDVWFSFVAPTSGTVDCLITRGSMTSANFNIYSGICTNLNAIANTCNFNLTTPTTESLTGLTPNATYYIQVWSSFTEQGTFTLRLTNPNLATATFDNSNFEVYPNPVKDIVNISYTQNIDKVQVINLLGQEVITKSINTNEGQIDMSNLSKGVYLIKVTSENLMRIIKIMKE